MSFRAIGAILVSVAVTLLVIFIGRKIPFTQPFIDRALTG